MRLLFQMAPGADNDTKNRIVGSVSAMLNDVEKQKLWRETLLSAFMPVPGTRGRSCCRIIAKYYSWSITSVL